MDKIFSRKNLLIMSIFSGLLILVMTLLYIFFVGNIKDIQGISTAINVLKIIGYMLLFEGFLIIVKAISYMLRVLYFKDSMPYIKIMCLLSFIVFILLALCIPTLKDIIALMHTDVFAIFNVIDDINIVKNLILAILVLEVLIAVYAVYNLLSKKKYL
mgnify:CR=1 FL=1